MTAKQFFSNPITITVGSLIIIGGGLWLGRKYLGWFGGSSEAPKACEPPCPATHYCNGNYGICETDLEYVSRQGGGGGSTDQAKNCWEGCHAAMVKCGSDPICAETFLECENTCIISSIAPPASEKDRNKLQDCIKAYWACKKAGQAECVLDFETCSGIKLQSPPPPKDELFSGCIKKTGPAGSSSCPEGYQFVSGGHGDGYYELCCPKKPPVKYYTRGRILTPTPRPSSNPDGGPRPTGTPGVR